MKSERLSVEHGLYALAFLLALSVRMININAAPLSDFEASWAMQALQVARGGVPVLGAQPSYSLLTGVLFFLFSSSNVLARLLPVLAGSSLVLLPVFFRSLFGRAEAGKLAALVLAFGLAFDPGMVAISRLAGGPALAMAFGLFSLGFWLVGWPLWAAVFGAAALLSGPSILVGAVGLGLALAVAYGLKKFSLLDWLDELLSSRRVQSQVDAETQTSSKPGRRDVLWAGLAAFIIIGTLFFRYPQGLSAFANTLPVYLQGWLPSAANNPASTPAVLMLVALVVYQPMALLMGTIGAVLAWRRRDSLGMWLSLWVGLALLLNLLYPARQVTDLGWVLLPLWVLAAQQISQVLTLATEDRLATTGQAALIIVLMVLGWLNFTGLTIMGMDPESSRLRWLLIGGVLVLSFLATALVWLGWSANIAIKGLAAGGLLGLGLFVLSATFGVTRMRLPSTEGELWAPLPIAGQEAQLLSSLGDLAEWQHGYRNLLDIVVVAPGGTETMPSLSWALRDFPSARFVDVLDPGSLPSVVIAPEEKTDINLALSYRGESFIWRGYPIWQEGLSQAWIPWVVFRRIPIQPERLTLWARSDIFPGGQLTSGLDQIPAGQPAVLPTP